MKSNSKNAIYNALGFIFPASVILFTTPYYVHKLTTEVYGIYILAISLMGLMSFLDLGFGQGIIKFIAHYEAKSDFPKINSIINTSLILYVVMGLTGGLIIFFASEFLVIKIFKISKDYLFSAILAFKIIAFGFLVNFINGVFSNIPKAMQRYDVSVKIQNAIWFISVMIGVYLLYLGYGLVPLLIAQLVFQSIGILLYVLILKKLLPSYHFSVSFDKTVFREIFGFSFYTAVNSISGNIVFRLDKIIVGYFLGTKAVSYYQIAFMLPQMVQSFVSAVSQFLFPSVSYLNANGNKINLLNEYYRFSKYIVAASLILISILILSGENFMYLWVGEDIALNSSKFLPFLSFVFFFQSISVVGYYFYNGLGFSKINMISSLFGSALYLIIATTLIPTFSLTGAAVAFGATLVPFPFYYHLLHKIIQANNRIFWGLIIKATLILLCVLLIKHEIISGTNMYSLVIVISLGIIAVLSSIFAMKIIEIKEIKHIIRKPS